MTPAQAEKPLVLWREDVARLLQIDECIAAVEQAFRLHAEGRALGPGVLSVHAAEGAFHIKAAGLPLSRSYFAAKVNGNFPGNRERFGLPTIQGVIVLCDAERGTPLAVMDSIEITGLRTAAATAVAARHLARPDSATVAVCGCGVQGREQLRALMRVLPLRRARLFDVDRMRAEALAAEVARELGLHATCAPDVGAATRGADVVVTCTTSRRAFLSASDVSAGAFVAGVGADNPQKQELDPGLLASAKVVVDSLDQCAEMGDLRGAIAAGAMSRDQVHAELGEIVAGRKPGRASPDEIVVFDSTGTALQDVAAAVAVYERARAGNGKGLRIGLTSWA